ncbi:hypothetical protein GBAR_LOCUS20941 [Geodia barretti]|uniref:Uncharacterized protein n=1 Tax=Geodia barretti TaxID=519541 RepID=A0AA35SXT7_GEOBA|nr:hypothetical protein GBAR_LOCUS20941 [Geodia barretti]
MRRFAENTDTVNLFKEAAQSQNFDNDGDCKRKVPNRCLTYNEVLREHPLVFSSSDPRDFRNDVLAKVIPRILNPLEKRNNFYDQPENCPSWFPKSRVRFRRPNHPKRKNDPPQ